MVSSLPQRLLLTSSVLKSLARPRRRAAAAAMELDGRQYERIWQHDGRNGGLQMSMADVQALAARASSIHIRLGAEDHSVTLKEGVRWPLEQLALGRTFDRRLDGYAVTEATVAASWIGAAAPAMVTVGGAAAG